MAIKSLEQKKRQQILLIVGIVIIVIAIIILYFTFWGEGGNILEQISPETEPLVIEQGAELLSKKDLEGIDLDFSFLSQTILSFLKIHGNLPVEKGETGRNNPFIPY